MSVSVVWHGIQEAQAAMEAQVAKARAGTRLGIVRAAHAVEAAAKKEAPVVLGTLRRSIHVEGPTPTGADSWMAIIGPSVIYGRRVELGFKGTDALGRKYNQDGNPYMKRGLASVSGALPAIFSTAWRETMSL